MCWEWPPVVPAFIEAESTDFSPIIWEQHVVANLKVRVLSLSVWVMSQAFMIQNIVEWLSWLHFHRLWTSLFTDWIAAVSSLSQIRFRFFSKAKLSSTVTVRKCHTILWHFRRKTWHYWHMLSCNIFFNHGDEQWKILVHWLLILCKYNFLCYLSCLDLKELDKNEDLKNCDITDVKVTLLIHF